MQALTLYFDGSCPLCVAEIAMLKRRNGLGLLRFVDIARTPEQLPCAVSCAAAMAAMHGRLADGQLLSGVGVFAEAYRRAGLPLLAWLLSRPALQPLLGVAYRAFARHRTRIARVLGPLLPTLIPPPSHPHPGDHP